MKKNNKFTKMISLFLMVTVVAVILISGTYAKYTTTASGTGSAVIAKWDIKAGATGNEVSITGSSPSVAFNLFSTILDTANGNAETDVASGKIAPGTKGSFELSVVNDSEVNVTYAIDFTVTNPANCNIQFSTDGGTTWASDLTDITATAIAMGNSAPITVDWQWVFGDPANNTNDTAVGVASATSAQSVTVQADLTVSQVD